jgi:hypothetical protein
MRVVKCDPLEFVMTFKQPSLKPAGEHTVILSTWSVSWILSRVCRTTKCSSLPRLALPDVKDRLHAGGAMLLKTHSKIMANQAGLNEGSLGAAGDPWLILAESFRA